MKKKLYLCVFLLFLGMLFLVYKYQSADRVSNSRSVQNQSNVAIDSNFENALVSRTTLDVRGNLTDRQSQKLDVQTNYLEKKQFFGAYISVVNNKVLFSGNSGMANADTANSFKLDSTLMVGDYQELIDNGLLLKLIDKRNIALTDKVNKYIPGLKNEPELTLSDLIVNGSNLYLNKKYTNLEAEHLKGSYFVERASHSKQFEPGDVFLKRMLISKWSQYNYRETVNKLFVNPMNLTNTTFYNSDSVQANDVIGYKYLKKEKKLIQKNAVLVDSSQSQLKMSVRDILISFKALGSNEVFPKKYNSIYKKSFNNINSANYTNKKYTVNTKSFGQYIYIKSNSDCKHIVIVVTNYDNPAIRFEKVLNKLFEI